MSPGVLVAALELQWIIWPLLFVVFSLGVLASFSPDHFAGLANRGSHWIDTDKLRQFLERPINVDRHVLRYSRVFGLLVMLAALWLAYLFWTR
ncbi:MAG TPA: hypothetical protein VL096_19205 [Pirellulaceae bacterium]|nr:hypothetical protein [Pirellulaceae bacterium]